MLEGALRADPDLRRRVIHEFDVRARTYTPRKRLVLDLLSIRDPRGISLPARPGELGVGDPFSFPFQSVESLALLGAERPLVANDNNYVFSDRRWIARDKI